MYITLEEYVDDLERLYYARRHLNIEQRCSKHELWPHEGR